MAAPRSFARGDRRVEDERNVMCGVKQGYHEDGVQKYCHEHSDHTGCTVFRDHEDRRRFVCRGRVLWQRENKKWIYRWCTKLVKGGVKGGKHYCHQHLGAYSS